MLEHMDAVPESEGSSSLINELRAEIAKLRAENDRLREELRHAARQQHETPPHYL